MLNLLIKESEIQLINSVYELINEIEEFIGKFEREQYSNLRDAKEGLEKIKEDLRQRYEKIRDEIDFWRKLSPEYVPESKNINILTNKLEKLKRKCKERYKSFAVLEQLYNQKLYDRVENLEEFALNLDEIISYFPDMRIKSENDIDTVKEIHNQLSWLKEIKYPQIEELFMGLTFENTKNFFNKVEEIKEEYDRLKEDLSTYQRILGKEEEQIKDFPSLKQKVEEYKTDLQKRIGIGFESLIRFLKGETEDIDANAETLINFIKTVKPLLKEVLRV